VRSETKEYALSHALSKKESLSCFNLPGTGRWGSILDCQERPS
jgi:hypothetical protein